ncbi:MAG: hypothetical protein U9O54_03670 [Chloroflexota bacterium]|nr:hypothetical protein [Chloroflexota bacterium]
MTDAQLKTLKLLNQLSQLDKEIEEAETKLWQLKKKRHPVLFNILGWFKQPRFRRQ